MFEPDIVEGFEWDSGNAGKNEKHGVTRQEAEQVFFNHPLLVLEDLAHSRNEPRLHALGKTMDGRFLHVTFTLRESGRLIRVISARSMHRKERLVYGQTAKTDS